MLVGTIAVESSELLSRMLKREGIVHNVLNAKFVQQEAEIVAQAGQRGAVTIATNMAGRGTDIKLGPGVNKIQGLYVANAKYRVVETIGPDTVDRRGRACHQRALRHRHRAARIAAHRPPVARTLRAPGRPGLLELLRLLRGRPDAQLRRLAPAERRDDQARHEGRRGTPASVAQQSVESAQRRVEERNYVSRKYTLQYDDVMNQQRTVIYTWRNDILITETPRDEIFDVVRK